PAPGRDEHRVVAQTQRTAGASGHSAAGGDQRWWAGGGSGRCRHPAVGDQAHGAVLPLWFLVAYLTVVVLTPVMYPLHRRFGLAVPLVLVVLMVFGDLARMGLGLEWAATGNFLFLWLAAAQAGFAWQDGRLPATPRVAVPLLLLGLGAVV